MTGILAGRDMDGPSRDIFLAKLSLIHRTVAEVRASRERELAEEISSRPAGAMMVAEERT